MMDWWLFSFGMGSIFGRQLVWHVSEMDKMRQDEEKSKYSMSHVHVLLGRKQILFHGNLKALDI